MIPKNARELSLACGEGRHERSMFSLCFEGSVAGVDLSRNSVAMASEAAKEKKLSITYYVEDFMQFNAGEYFDLVLCFNFLHHIVNLEECLEKIESFVKAEGIIYVSDFIGESRFRWFDKRLDILNKMFNSLPKELRYSHRFNKVMGDFHRPNPENIASPFEAIRSEEIARLLKNKFEVVMSDEKNALIHLLFDIQFRPSYAGFENGSAILAVIACLDDLIIQEGVLPPLSGEYVLRKKY